MTTRKRNPTTGRYQPTKRTLAFRKVVQQRRAEVAEAAKLQRKANIAALNAVIAKAQAAERAARAAERAAQGHAEPTEGTAAPDAPADSELGAEGDTEPQPE